MKTLEYEDIVKSKSSYTFVDVRSPSEFIESTIPGSINIPLFNDMERAEVGTIYKQSGKSEAIKHGISLVSSNLPKIYECFTKLPKKQIVIFCARGGMRSGSVASLFDSLGYPIIRLSGGYKHYRKYITNTLPKLIQNITFVVLYGKTGVGKTNILKELKNKGYNTLDLEGCSNHRGSLLGGIGLGNINSQKQFESLVFDSLSCINSNIVFTEGESKRIGKILMPEYLMQGILDGRKILITASTEKRIEIIKEEYLFDGLDTEEIIQAITKLSRYITQNKIDSYIESIRKGSFDPVVEDLMLKYYDNAYVSNKTYEAQFVNNKLEDIADEIINYIF